MTRYIDGDRLRAEIERRKELLTPHKGQGVILCREIINQFDSLLSFIETISQPIMKDDIIDEIRAEIERRFSEYNHDSSHHIQAAECASILDFLDTLNTIDSLQQEQPEAPVDGEVHHVLNCRYLTTDNTQLCARLREFPEGAKVDIFIIAKEDK